MRRRIVVWMIVLLGMVVSPAAAETDWTDWTVTVRGHREDTFSRDEFKSAKTHSVHLREAEYEMKGSVNAYEGLPFSQIVAMSDGADSHHPYTFDRAAWDAGYEITVTAADGYAVTFDTSEVSHTDIMFVDTMDGDPVSPRLVGEIGKKLWITDITLIELHMAGMKTTLGPVDPDFTLVVDVSGSEHRYSLSELTKSHHYVEGPGSFTTSAGTTYTNQYGGVAFAAFLQDFLDLQPEDTITIVATDGYEMSYSASEIMDASDGTWILAMKQDGEFLPHDPGYIRTVKIGPNTPNIDGHNSVKMISRIELSGEPYREFALKFSGLMNLTIDRQTMQSGVSCHAKVVQFERKNTKGEYEGIPLWRLLAYSDDPTYAPHRQDSSIISYNKKASEEGYLIELVAADGFSITLDSRQVDGNEDLIVAMYKDGAELPPDEWPLVLVWDKNAAVVPEGAKPIKQITEIRLKM
jgi:DMSO/TMAO reductase YedYZ molybdopterin-dependent catalytic subunit